LDNKEFDFEAFKKQAIEGMYAGKPLNGENGIFALLLKHFLEAALEGELHAHLQEEKASGNTNRKFSISVESSWILFYKNVEEVTITPENSNTPLLCLPKYKKLTSVK
jgi:hypothetical protein